MAGIISGVVWNSSDQFIAGRVKSDIGDVKMEEDSEEQTQPAHHSGQSVDLANSAEDPSAHAASVIQVQNTSRPSKPFHCDICTQAFACDVDFTWHRQSHSQDSVSLEKTVCQQEAQTHVPIDTKSDEEFPAVHFEDSKQTSSSDGASLQMSSGRGGRGRRQQRKSLGCEYCTKTFKHRKQMTKHVKVYHSDKIRAHEANHMQESAQHCSDGAEEHDDVVRVPDVELFEAHAGAVVGQDGSKEELPVSSEHEDFDSGCDSQPQQGKCIAPRTRNSVSMTQFLSSRQSLTCDFCPQIFRTAEQVLKHMQVSHKDELGPHLRSTGPVKQKGRPRMSRMCDYCSKIFTKRASVLVHMRTAHPEKVNWTPKSFLCSECGHSFTTQSILKSHIRRHQNIRSYHCEMCPKSFLTAGDLKDHRQGVHFGIRRFLCTRCGAAFKRQYALQCHMRTHSGQREHTCSVCNKAFKERHQLNRHMSLHSSEKPYACQFCQAKYSHKGGLRIHLQRSKACPGSQAMKNKTS